MRAALSSRLGWVALLAVALLAMAPPAVDEERGAYDPLRRTAGRVRTIDLDVHDAKRSRDIPIRVYLPAGSEPAPVVLFSHGLGGSRAGCAYLGEHRAAHRYVAEVLQHPGSGDAV